MVRLHESLTIFFDQKKKVISWRNKGECRLQFSMFQKIESVKYKLFYLYSQEGLPVRLKAIHVLNTKPLIDKIMILVKPFMKKELLNMVNMELIRKIIDYNIMYFDLINLLL